MANDIEIGALIVCSFYLLLLSVGMNNCKRKRRPPKYWVKPWITQRSIKGAYNTLFNDLANTDRESFNNYMRMDFSIFDDLLSRIESKLTHKDTRMRCAISPRERLCVAIRFLATGL